MEDVTFVGWHLQGFLDGVGEAVAREAEVLEHLWFQWIFPFFKVRVHRLINTTLY